MGLGGVKGDDAQVHDGYRRIGLNIIQTIIV